MYVVIHCAKVVLNYCSLKVIYSLHFGNDTSLEQYFNEICVFFFFIFIGSGSCPDCNVPLRRNNFRVQMFEDPQVEKEVDIRRRILRDYNKKVIARSTVVCNCTT